LTRAVAVLGCIVALLGSGAERAAGQLPGMPVWNSPRGGTRLFFAAEEGLPDSAGGKGTTYAGRVAWGAQALTLSATVGVRNPEGTSSNLTEYGATAAYRLVGGSLIPISVNLQGGVANVSDSGVTDSRFTTAIGLAIDIPVPFVNVEPWVAPGLRVTHSGARGASPSQTDTEFGFAAGLTFGFGLFGFHTAVDYENLPAGGHATTWGLGVHIDIRPPLGL
jgi:hypothetical protein